MSCSKMNFYKQNTCFSILNSGSLHTPSRIVVDRQTLEWLRGQTLMLLHCVSVDCFYKGTDIFRKYSFCFPIFYSLTAWVSCFVFGRGLCTSWYCCRHIGLTCLVAFCTSLVHMYFLDVFPVGCVVLSHTFNSHCNYRQGSDLPCEKNC